LSFQYQAYTLRESFVSELSVDGSYNQPSREKY
jgi:hypothetical protein